MKFGIMHQALVSILPVIFLLPCTASGGFTETLPKGTFLIDESYMISSLDSAYNNQGRKAPLLDPIERYEPGGGLQGIIIPKAKVKYGILVNQLHYGILDNLSIGIGVPVVLYTEVNPNLEWQPGDFQQNLGRPYSEKDFWEWAASMGQPKPQKWIGNKGVLADIQLGLRYRFTDGFTWFDKNGLAMSVLLTGALPTGRQPDPEEIVAAGTTSWDLHSNGDIGLHLSMDKFFKKSLDGRLILGADVFYEFLLPHQYTSPEGEKNPLLLNYRPYVGKHYIIDGGDFSGASFQTDIVPYKGPTLSTWLTKHDMEKAKSLPPFLTLSFRYTFTYLQQTNWESNSEIWDWEREKLWRPGYKNILQGQAVFSLLRIGAPIQPYFAYRNQTWIPGKNCRAADVLNFGVRLLIKAW